MTKQLSDEAWGAKLRDVLDRDRDLTSLNLLSTAAGGLYSRLLYLQHVYSYTGLHLVSLRQPSLTPARDA